MNKASLALLPVLLGCGCSLTFYGLKDIKEDPKPKTAVACVEPRPVKAAIATAAPKAADKQPVDAKAQPDATAAAGAKAQPAEEPATGDERAAQGPSDQAPDEHSPSVATKP